MRRGTHLRGDKIDKIRVSGYSSMMWNRGTLHKDRKKTLICFNMSHSIHHRTSDTTGNQQIKLICLTAQRQRTDPSGSVVGFRRHRVYVRTPQRHFIANKQTKTQTLQQAPWSSEQLEAFRRTSSLLHFHNHNVLRFSSQKQKTSKLQVYIY